MSDPEKFLRIVQETTAQLGLNCFWVGGSLRDYFLKRESKDLDFAVRKHARVIASKIAAQLDGAFFALKEEQSIYRVTLKDGYQLDFAKFKGPDISQDLAARDFTINALAAELSKDWPGPSEKMKVLDPHNGLADIRARQVRPVSPDIFTDDPLRMLRAYRISAQLRFEITQDTLDSIARHKKLIQSPASERVREEIMLLLDCHDSAKHFRALDQSGLISEIMPETDPNRACALQYYPGKGVWGHSLDGLERLEWIFENLESEFGPDAGEIKTALDDRNCGADGHPLSSIMKLAILFHDIGKAETAETIDGRMRFFEHEYVGAKMAAKMARRLRFGADSEKSLRQLVQSHMRPGGLAHAPTITDRAKLRFFRDLKELAVPMLIVSLADRYTYLTDDELGKGRDLHEKFVKEILLWHYQKLRETPPDQPKILDGNDIMAEFKLPPGPLIGKILEAVTEARALNEITTREDAVQFVKNYLTSLLKK